jgi:hypothetical protein
MIFMKEVNKMPGGDRTGPAGSGPLTGRGMGSCRGFSSSGLISSGEGFGIRRGGRFGRRRRWRHLGFGRFWEHPDPQEKKAANK